MRGLLYGELSYEVIGAAFDVYNALGPHYREAVYQKGLELELGRRKVEFDRKRMIDLLYRDARIGRYQLDLVVENAIVLELKAAEFIHPQHVSQVIQYLAITGMRLGIVMNFGNLDRLEYRRVPFGPTNHTDHTNRFV